MVVPAGDHFLRRFDFVLSVGVFMETKDCRIPSSARGIGAGGRGAPAYRAFAGRRCITRKLREHGATHRGGWNSPQSQELRFAQLLRACRSRQSSHQRLADADMALGGLSADTDAFLWRMGWRRLGRDDRGRGTRHGGRPPVSSPASMMTPAPPFMIASGVFNVKPSMPA